MSSTELRRYIYRTLAYADIFDYPLTVKEIWYWLINSNQESVTVDQIKKKLPKLKNISHSSGYYYLSGQKKVVALRKEKQLHDQPKTKLARSISRWLKLIPSIELVAVTGSLAMSQAGENDDIDLMIVTSSGTMWVTRLLCVLLLEMLGKRRRPFTKQIKNKICLNLWFDAHHLALPKDKHDLYYAHEIMQARPLWDRHQTYEKFISANPWISQILPNAWEKKVVSCQLSVVSSRKIKKGNQILLAMESLACTVQLLYMRKRRTRETVTKYTAHFHPFDHHGWVMGEYGKRIRKW